ncbi:MAG: hypothetical protein JW751_01925 [Polyangiaceae bacterium]|nr:hypothetical protein [Polyangiaceae bacterium]
MADRLIVDRQREVRLPAELRVRLRAVARERQRPPERPGEGRAALRIAPAVAALEEATDLRLLVALRRAARNGAANPRYLFRSPLGLIAERAFPLASVLAGGELDALARPLPFVCRSRECSPIARVQ